MRDVLRALHRNRNACLTIAFLLLCVGVFLVPTGFEGKVDNKAIRCRGRVTAVDDSQVFRHGMVRSGDQTVELELLDGPRAGETVQGNNPLLGQMDRDKLFREGDTALVVLSLRPDGAIRFVNPQEHYRIGTELLLLGLFALFLIAFGGWTGFKALLSFVFAGLVIWRILVPLLLKGWNPILVTLAVVSFLCAAIIFLVAGITRKGLVAFLGSFLGVLTGCGLALYFTSALHLRGAVLPFAETMLYAGFGHLDLNQIFVAAVFLACSGAVMDLAMDVSASMDEVARNHPEIGRRELIRSGCNVGRAVVGTMTTTLLLAYSAGYITMLMVFMARGVPLTNTINLVYVAAEVAKTLAGSFGMVAVAPFTALVGGFVFRTKPAAVAAQTHAPQPVSPRAEPARMR